MRIERLEISSLRNLDTVTIEPCSGLNFFAGANGSGKTSLLEAIYLVVRGHSFRSRRIQPVIAHNADQLAVRIVISGDQADTNVNKDIAHSRAHTSIGVTKNRHNHTEVSVNGERNRKLSEVAAQLPIQTMLPNVSDLVFGGPGERREWLDWGLFHVKPNHIHVMRRYRRLLKQRNQALKLVSMGQADRSEVDVWSGPLAAEAETVNEYRRAYLQELEPLFSETLKNLAGDLNIGLEWRKGWVNEKELQETLVESYSRDVKLGATHYGPHRADLLISVIDSGAGSSLRIEDRQVGRQLAREVVSRGQGKMVATALKLTQARHLAETAGRRSIFLIDDVGAELDQAHGDSFFSFLERLESQIFATSTHPYKGGHFQTDNFLTFHVEQGQIV